MQDPHSADRSLKAKLRRRAVRLTVRKPARAPDRPMLSFAFDDAPATAARIGAKVLEQRGLRGSYFIAAGLAEADSPSGQIASLSDVARLAEAGHEIGCHTHSHLDCGQTATDRVLEDVEHNRETLAALGLPCPRTFAYPYGDVSFGPKRVLSRRFTLMRALHHGLIGGGSDLNQAPAVGIEGKDGELTARRWLARAAATRSWLILYTHDVCDDPSDWGCTPGALGGLADAALDGGFDVVTVAEGARRLG